MSKTCAICGKQLRSGVLVHKRCLPERPIKVSEYDLPVSGQSVLMYTEEGEWAEGCYHALTRTWTQYRGAKEVRALYWMHMPPEMEAK